VGTGVTYVVVGAGVSSTQPVSPKCERERQRLTLSTFRQNTRTMKFYEAYGFRSVGITHRNEESAAAVRYEWKR
jgi:ribosomal protein S18 acetylase RimI-like enzyme